MRAVFFLRRWWYGWVHRSPGKRIIYASTLLGKKERLRRHSGIYMVREWLRVPQDSLRKTYESHWRT